MVNTYVYKKISDQPKTVPFTDIKDWTECFIEDKTWDSSASYFTREFGNKCELTYFKNTEYCRPTNFNNIKEWLNNIRPSRDIDTVEKYHNLTIKLEQNPDLYLVISR